MNTVPASLFAPQDPSCPSCHARLNSLQHVCGVCGFRAEAACRRYPYEAPPMERFMDPESRLSARRRYDLEEVIDGFEARFPQVKFHVCIIRLPENSECREFGYWLFNSSPARTEDERMQRYHGILLLVDRFRRVASLTVGYGLDPFLGDDVLRAVMGEAHKSFTQGCYAEGIETVARELEEELRCAHAAAGRAVRAWKKRRQTAIKEAAGEPGTMDQSLVIGGVRA